MVAGEIGAFLVRLDLDDFEADFCCGFDFAGLGAIARDATLSEKTEKSKTKSNRMIPQQGSYNIQCARRHAKYGIYGGCL
jgi:hypothetical protein